MKLPTLTHFGELLDVPFAIAGTRQSRVASTTFINLVSIKVGKPCFDSPSGNKYRHLVIACAGLDTLIFAFVIKLLDATLNSQVIPVDYYSKIALNSVSTPAIFPQFLRKILTYMFLCRSLSLGPRNNPDSSFVPTHFNKESCDESRMLLVFAKQD